MGYKTKRKKVVGTDITNTTTQHSDGRIRHTRTTRIGNTTTSTSRNSNGSLRVTKTYKSNGYTHRSQKTYGSPSKVKRSKSKDLSTSTILLIIIGCALLFVVSWLYSIFPTFTYYMLWFLFGVGVLLVTSWLIWTIWIFRYLILSLSILTGIFIIWNKYL